MAETHLESWQNCSAEALKWGTDFERKPISVNLVCPVGTVYPGNTPQYERTRGRKACQVLRGWEDGRTRTREANLFENYKRKANYMHPLNLRRYSRTIMTTWMVLSGIEREAE
ncbi:hypothetical protein PCH_Pc13g00990 [Penicillium rubens Wisconsin 54-1255]|uniref:Uncharacterized protein n=1 Tax=Penicillium rubens (strain ATCC 28089 / DSM 1075 / NRRL 1951 / Wisconsin 54-1255) TaxID=500485 RepID=B6H1L2_PENRW|nr:hypothetical protein PCH_Pc13g00990 [Penicillium rubens Wisconsin 54-1255]